ncbi:MAG TPA: MBL fold metallo-hydrolase [Candidatus Rifleibacterium sp.]|nr:MBL fold metallo-hydrolase [Candidatus Rifleibacterium sp.]HPT44847.1 MBL fold metallo-hydrolase [Candidatus Rifleibacterium sp.]
MELTRLSERTFCVCGPANVGVIALEDSRVALIDSGNEEKYAVKLFELLSDYRFKVAYILNTHAHADHIGGNSFFAEKTGCRILASTLEAPTIRQPLIQSAVLFAGAPVQDLMNRFTMANPSAVDVLSGTELTLDDVQIKILDLPGHSVNQKGFLVDGVAFVADTLFPDSFFKKQRLPFTYDPHAQMQTLQKLRNLTAKVYVGGHFRPTDNIATMITGNLSHVENAMNFMRELLKVPQSQERVVKAFLDHFGLKKISWEYFLYRTTVNGYLSSLYNRGEIKFRVLDNLAVWYAV